MRTRAFCLAALLLAQTFCPALQQSSALAQAQTPAAAEDSDAFLHSATRPRRPAHDYSQRVEALLRRMTLEEKIGQMTQLQIGMVTSGSNQTIQIDPAKLDKAVVKYGVGSILNVSDQALTADKWHEIIGQIQQAAARTRLRIPVIYGIDSIHGANYVQGTTLYPQETGMAATWNPELMQRLAEVTAMETRAAGIPWTFSPVLDIGRQPLWPRFYPTFAEAVRAGAHTVMVNSAEINGTPGHINHHVLTDILKGELGFKGFVVSDWEDIKKLVSQWRVAADEKEATRMAVMAGIDMSMVPSDYSFPDIMVQLVKEGKIPQSRVDDAVRRILLVKFELGLFDNPMPDPALKSRLGLPASRQLALQAARESMTLLKNDGQLLPLAKGRKVLVTGPTADSLLALNNGWTYVWQGSEESLYPKDRPTIRRAIEEKVGAKNVTYVPGTRLTRSPGAPNGTPTLTDEEVDIAAAARAARSADVVVLCLGEGSYAETPGNITDLTLGSPQLKLAEAVEAAGKPVVLVLVEGRPRVLGTASDRAQAVLMAYNPSNEGGTAVADVLFGDFNPGGRLPFTHPRSVNNLFNY